MLYQLSYEVPYTGGKRNMGAKYTLTACYCALRELCACKTLYALRTKHAHVEQYCSCLFNSLDTSAKGNALFFSCRFIRLILRVKGIVMFAVLRNTRCLIHLAVRNQFSVFRFRKVFLCHSRKGCIRIAHFPTEANRKHQFLCFYFESQRIYAFNPAKKVKKVHFLCERRFP